MKDIHEGDGGNHAEARSLAFKVLRQGYFWPYMSYDPKQIVMNYDKCQRFGNIIHQSAHQLVNVSSPWPFYKWGLDIMGPFPITKKEEFPSTLYQVCNVFGLAA